MFDKEVTRQQIQSLNDIEAIIAFLPILAMTRTAASNKPLPTLG